MSSTQIRDNALNDRHRALGSDLDPSVHWNNMPIPQVYSTDPQDETVAVRTRAGLFDVSALQLIDVSGPDALSLLNWLVTADLTKVKAGQSLITTIVDEQGGLIDDVLIYVDGADRFRVSRRDKQRPAPPSNVVEQKHCNIGNGLRPAEQQHEEPGRI